MDLGSVRDLVDQSGAVQDTIAYDGFGNILSESNEEVGGRFKYTAPEFDCLAACACRRCSGPSVR